MAKMTSSIFTSISTSTQQYTTIVSYEHHPYCLSLPLRDALADLLSRVAVHTHSLARQCALI